MSRLPQPPLPFQELFAQLSPQEFERAALAGLTDRYLHWDQLRHRTPPEGFDHRLWWIALKLKRIGTLRPIPLQDPHGEPFVYGLPDRLNALLHQIDMQGGASVLAPAGTVTGENRDRYRISQLREEAIASSQIEGAVTTRAVARELIRTARAPRDRSERMIVNNFRAMQRLGELKTQALSPDVVFELHRILTEGTLERDEDAGRLRGESDRIVITDNDGNIYHTPPPASELPGRLDAMCAFANGDTPDGFVHPIVRGILLHFWLAYDHPFVDGNGRTARALFYWLVLHRGYWLMEYLSISRIIHRARRRYYDAFLHTESDANDATYFLLDQAQTLEQALAELRDYLEDRTHRMRVAEQRLRGIPNLNHRQKGLLEHALRTPDTRYTIEGHRTSNAVVYATARADLLDLVERGLLVQAKVGRALVFAAPADLEEKLRPPE